MDKQSFIWKICEDFLESKDMAKHVMNCLAKSNYKNLHGIYRIINASRAPLDKNARALEMLSPLSFEENEDEHYAPVKLAQEMRLALTETKHIRRGTVFLVTQYCKNFEHREHSDQYLIMVSAGPPFTTFDDALKYIRKETQDECSAYNPLDIPSDDCNGWSKIERWDTTSDGKLMLALSSNLSFTGTIWDYEWENAKQGQSQILCKLQTME